MPSQPPRDCAATTARRRLPAALTALALALPMLAAPAFTTPDHRVSRSVGHGFSSSTWGDRLADLVSLGIDGRNAASADPGSLYTIENAIGARLVWQQGDGAGRPVTGQGVTVALLDSGTAAVTGLDAPGKLAYGPDLSIESNGSLTDQDTFGHGTHLAGIIAAHDPVTLTRKNISTLNPSVQLGVAPDAGLLSLKLATTDGSTDVSQVIAALDWITQQQTAPDGTRVRVVNLSFGTSSVQPYQLDPLAAAAENAWRHGLVVVVSGGNDGQQAFHLNDPAIDPYVLSVGASDGKDSVTGWAVPAVADFSNSGTADRHVDLLAPGTSLVSLRDPGSFVDVNHPEGLVQGDTTGRLFRGSGTSQAAAVVSGAAALLLQAYPDLTPDQVKAVLMRTATPVPASPIYAGAGQLNVAAAYALVKAARLARLIGAQDPVTSVPAQSFPVATGQGSLDAARGDSVLVDADGRPVNGEVDVQGTPWNAAAWWAATSTASAWSDGSWLGVVWTGAGWLPGDGLSAARWANARWASARWADAEWDSARWSNARWANARWASARWANARWAGDNWG